MLYKLDSAEGILPNYFDVTEINIDVDLNHSKEKKQNYPKKHLIYVGNTVAPKLIWKFIESLSLDTKLKYYYRSSISGLFDYLIRYNCTPFEYISIDYELLNQDSIFETITTIRTLIKSFRDTPVYIGIVIGDDTPQELLRSVMLIKSIDYITLRIGGKFTYQDAVESANRIYNLNFTVPDKIKDLVQKSKQKTTQSSQKKLTARQSQILQLIRDRGLGNKQISRILNISESAVKAQLTQIFRKVGVQNRLQLSSFGRTDV